MLKSVCDNGHNFEECKEILRKSRIIAECFEKRSIDLSSALDIKLDPGFKNFYRWCRENNVPVIIVSS
jgi:hypothetical protein